MVNSSLLLLIIMSFIIKLQVFPFTFNNHIVERNIGSKEPIISTHNYSSCIALYLSKHTSDSFTPKNIYLQEHTSDLNKDKVYLEIQRNSKFKKWSETIIEDSISLSTIKLSNVSYYLFTSPIKNATGIGINYHSIFLFDSSTKLVFTSYTLTNKRGSFYYDLKSKETKLLIFTFDDSFIHIKDYDKIKVNYRIVTLKKGIIHKSKLLSLKCANN